MKMILIIALVFLVALICWGCARSASQGKAAASQSAWQKYRNIEELWPRIKNEKIESFSFCDADPQTDIESWYVFNRVPDDRLQQVVQLFGEDMQGAADAPHGYCYGEHETCQEWLRITTDKGRYVAPLYAHTPQNNWQERASLVGLWPRLQKEKIESIGFCTEDVGTDIDSWDCWSVPKGNLDECIGLIDNAMRSADPNSFMEGPVWEGRMKIITNKGKYLVPAETEIVGAASPHVLGNEWKSYELGKFIAKHRFPDHEYKYILPPKDEVVAILLYPRRLAPPVAFFGDKKLAEELAFNPKIKDDPNGLKGIADLYKFGRIRSFGVETRTENGRIVWSNELRPEKSFEGRQWLEKIMDAFEIALKEAMDREKYYPGSHDSANARITFMTRDDDYRKEIVIGSDSVYDDYVRSEQLKKFFDELGLTNRLLTGTPDPGKQSER